MQLSRKRQQQAVKKFTPRARLIKRIAWGFLVALCLGGLVTALWYATRVSSLTITEVNVVGGPTISTDEVQRIANETLTGAYYRLVPKRFAWTYPRQTLIERISRIPRIKQVAVTRTNGTSLQVLFDEYVPAALWCNQENSDCVFLDANGYAFGVAPELFGAALVRYRHFDTPPNVGERAFSPTIIERTEDFVEAAESSLGLRIISVTLTSPTELQYEVAGGGLIRTSLDVSYEDTVKNVETIFDSEEFTDIGPGNFQYIDLRFGNKVFVNEEIAPAAVAEETIEALNE